MAFVSVLTKLGRNVNKLTASSNHVRFKSIKAAVLEEYNKPLVIKQVEGDKKVGKNEVKIKVSHCSVNQSDYEITNDLHEYKPKLPFIPGYELSGELIEVGKTAKEKGFHVGDKVIGLNKEACGGFAEECVVVSEDCFHIPQGVSLRKCSALLDGYITALLGLVRRGRITEGDTVLITAAGGGVGLAAVDLAANVYKTKVIAVCSTEDKAALVREKGAFASIKYSNKLAKEVKSITKDKGVNLVFDATGGEVFTTALNCLTNEGRIVLASNAARSVQNFSLSSLLPNSVSVTGVSPWHYRKNDLESYKQSIEDIIDMAEQELIVPHISKEFDMENINEAFAYILNAKCTGKVVVKIDD